NRRADERGIDPLIAQIIDEIRCATFLESKRHQRESVPIGANDTRYEGMKRARTREPYGNLPLLAARGAFGRRERMIDVGQNRASIGEQHRAAIVQLAAARLAAK